jgi:hypothetical protein
MFARILFLVCIIGIATGIAYLMKIPALQVESVEVTGISQLSAGEIEVQVMDSIIASRHLFGIIPSTNTLFVDEDSIEKRVSEDFPTANSVSVKTTFGGKVKVSIEERKTVAIWCDESMLQCFQMDSTGYLFMAAPASTTAEALIFRGILRDAEGPLIKQRFLSGKEIVVFADAKVLLEQTAKKIDYVSCESSAYCAIKIVGNGVLKVNPQDDLANAFDRLASALKSPVFGKSNFEYIDLRFGNKLFYKLDDGTTNEEAGADDR